MRTKALLLTAAICAIGAATASAQVYSVNAVGYVNVTLKKGWNMIANPLNNGDNKLSTILPATTPLPDDTQIQTWDSAKGAVGGIASTIAFFYAGAGWDNELTLAPGAGFYINVPATAPNATYTITFVGEVPQGNLSTQIRGGGRYNMVASQVPQAGKISTDLGLTAASDDTAYLWDKNTGKFSSVIYQYIDGVGWTDGNDLVEPSLSVGDGFFLLRSAAAPTAWTRTFNVNQ